MKYPAEAYETLNDDYLRLTIPVYGYSKGFNNPNSEFQNPYFSEASSNLTVLYTRKNTDMVWDINATVGEYIEKPGHGNKYVVSKEIPVKIYNQNNYNDISDTYKTNWRLSINEYKNVKGVVLEEANEDGLIKNDEFIDVDGSNISMHDYIKVTNIRSFRLYN